MADTAATATTPPFDSNSRDLPWYSRSEHQGEINVALLSTIEDQFSYVKQKLTGVKRKNSQLDVFHYEEPEETPATTTTAEATPQHEGNRASTEQVQRDTEDNIDNSIVSSIEDAIDIDADFVMILLPHIFQHRSSHGFDPREPGSMNFTIGLSKETFDAAMEKLQVHPLFLEALFSRAGQYGILDSYGSAPDATDIVHIIVKVPPAGHLEAAFYIRFDTKTHGLRIIIAGDGLIPLAQDAINYLQLGQASDPFEFTLIFLRRYYYFLDAQCVQVSHAVIMTERETGRGAVAYSDGEANRIISPDKFDLTFMHWIEGNQRNLVYAAQFQSRLISFFSKEHVVRASLGKTRASPQDSHHSLPQKARSLHARLLLHQTAVEGLHAESLVMRERIQRQLSAADSIINQYDNKISLENAAANTTIAEQSRKIAFETQKDSTSMKTIAGLTMVYLPITFTATIFSTGFFTYGDGDGALMVNSRIWIFFVVGIILTIITVVVWVSLNKYGIPKQLSWARHANSLDEQPGLSSTAISKHATMFQQGPDRPTVQVLSNPRVDLPARA